MVGGLAPGALTVHRVAPPGFDPPPLIGDTRREGDGLVFEPRFPFDRGLTYLARLQSDGPVREFEFSFPPIEVLPKVELVLVTPTADHLPANLLKFYLHFSAPMSRGEAYRRVRLLDDAGRVLEGAFLELQEELWDPDTRRLTLLIDPGRIKRGLVLHEELGPVLEPDRRYTLQVDREWRDGRGAPLLRGLSKTFVTVAADVQSPDPWAWSLSTPVAGTRQALEVELDEALDHALLERVVYVLGPRGDELPGVARVLEGERSWNWTPKDPWAAGPHRLAVEAILEDLAGNSVGRPFELDRRVWPDLDPSDESVLLEFEVTRPADE